MTIEKLQKILSSDFKFNVQQIKQFIYDMKSDVIEQIFEHNNSTEIERFYRGELNAFQICLDLLDHCESEVTTNEP